jgi:hypothetical protein
MRWKSLLAVAAVAALVGLLPSQAGAQYYRPGITAPGYSMTIYYPPNSYYYPGISNEPFATNYYYPRFYNYPPTTNLFSWGYSGSAYAPGINHYAYIPADTTYINPGLRALYAQGYAGYNGYAVPAYNGYTLSGYYGSGAPAPSAYSAQGGGIYVPGYGGVSIGAGGSSIYVPNYP